jgi:thiol:disulfide interchange protein
VLWWCGYKIAGMASPKKPAAPSPRKGSPLLLILVLAVVAAAGTFFYLHSTEKTPEPAAPASAPVAAPQAEAPVARVLPKNHIYDEVVDPKVEIAAALKKAKQEHKRVILDFGGDWCGDCQVLDLYFKQAPNAALLNDNFVLVHVFIGRMDKNLDIPAKYDVPVKKGVPALAVLDANGRLLFSQTAGEFENMRNMESTSVADFLNRWKA